MLKYLRFKLFYRLMSPFGKAMRRKRMALFSQILMPTAGMKILDLGGQPEIWDSVQVPLNITCVNLPGIAVKDHPSHHTMTYLDGDACNMPYFKQGDFDLVFSNSVIEHVGDVTKRSQFANEVIRLARK